MYVRYPTFKEDPAVSLAGLRMRVEYFDLLSVDVTYSQDKKSFDARAILRSTYHQAFLERNLASLPDPDEDEDDADDEQLSVCTSRC